MKAVCFVFAAMLVDTASAQVFYPQFPTTGYVDPTASGYNGNHPMVACSSACSSATINQNIDALQQAITDGCAGSHPEIVIPPGEYPVWKGGPSHNLIYGVQISGCSGLVIRGYGATLRSTGAAGGTTFHYQIQIVNSSNVRILGLGMSQRDVTGSPVSEHVHMIEIGNQTSVDNVQVVDCKFAEGAGGDAINFLGGSDMLTLDTRVVIAGNYIDGKRTGVAFQHGTAMVDIIGNFFGPNGSDQFLDHEPTTCPGNLYENDIGNMLKRAPQGAQTVTISGAGNTPNCSSNDNVYAYNVIDGGIQGIHVRRNWFVGNLIDNPSTNNIPGITISRIAHDVWIEDNIINQRQTGGIDAQGIFLGANGGFAPRNVWAMRNRIREWSCFTGCAGIGLQGFPDVWAIENEISYHAALADQFLPVAITSDGGTIYGDGTQAVSSGFAVANRTVRGLQADGVTLAGRPLCGIDFSKGSNPSLGHAMARDNFIDSAKETLIMLEGSMPQGPPVVSGNVGASVTTDNLPASWVSETAQGADRLTASGAMSPSTTATIVVGDCGADADTIADGVRDGEIKDVEINSSCDSTGTLTPTHFGDGTSIAWSTTAGNRNGSFQLVWDAAGAVWWIGDRTSIVTVNP